MHKHVEIIQIAAGLGVEYIVGMSSWRVLNFSLEAMGEHWVAFNWRAWEGKRAQRDSDNTTPSCRSPGFDSKHSYSDSKHAWFQFQGWMASDLCGHQETQVEHTLYRFPGLKKLSFCFEKGLSLCVPLLECFLTCCICLPVCCVCGFSTATCLLWKYCLSLNSLTGRESETNQDS